MTIVVPLAAKAVGRLCDVYVPVWLGFRYSGAGLLCKVEVLLGLQPILVQRCARAFIKCFGVKGHVD